MFSCTLYNFFWKHLFIFLFFLWNYNSIVQKCMLWIYIKIQAMSVNLWLLFLTPFPWTNLRTKYIYGFLLTWRRYSDRFKGNKWEFYLSYSENCPSQHFAMCPSEQNTQKVSFQTCCHVSFQTSAMCTFEHKAKIK